MDETSDEDEAYNEADEGDGDEGSGDEEGEAGPGALRWHEIQAVPVRDPVSGKEVRGFI